MADAAGIDEYLDDDDSDPDRAEKFDAEIVEAVDDAKGGTGIHEIAATLNQDPGRSATAVETQLIGLLSKTKITLLALDCSKVRYCDSRCIAMLVKVRDEARGRGGDLVLHAISKPLTLALEQRNMRKEFTFA